MGAAHVGKSLNICAGRGAPGTMARMPKNDVGTLTQRLVDLLHTLLKAAPLAAVADYAPFYYAVVLGTAIVGG